ncbi:MAG: hypothetical protein JXL84_18745 [Deltaproteobacteria bacterium]|nr:hypothetical protein [Deltaproteobacteria bacterium]
MGEERTVERGIQSLVGEYRNAFRIPENLDYYSEADYKAAERQFVRFAVEHCRLDFLLSQG